MKKISRSHRSGRNRGGFPFGLTRKTTPASLSAEASRHFVNRSATPPFLRLRAAALALRGGDARRGILPSDNLFTVMTRLQFKQCFLASCIIRWKQLLRKDLVRLARPTTADAP